MNKEFEIIDRYFDGECSKDEEIILFTRLSKSEEAREYFKSINTLKDISGKMAEDFPDSLDERILTSVKNEAIKDEKFFSGKINSHLFYYAAAAVIFFGLLIGYWEVDNYKTNLEITTRKIEKQEKLINLIMNSSLPPAEIKTQYANEIIVTSEL